MSEKIILDTSNEAASNQKITGWVCRTGHFWGCDERMARYSGATHLTCNCGQVYPKSSYCEPCHEQKRHERYLALPKATWDGVAMLYSDKYDAYFNDTEEVEQFCRTRKIKLTDLDLIICQPNYARPIDLTRISVGNGHYEIHPLIGTWLCLDDNGQPIPVIPAIDWVICGGESGANARPMHPQWAKYLRDQCKQAGVPFMFKQWGEWGPRSHCNHLVAIDYSLSGLSVNKTNMWRSKIMVDGHLIAEDAEMLRVGKKMAGRLLNGREHNGFPKAKD